MKTSSSDEEIKKNVVDQEKQEKILDFPIAAESKAHSDNQPGKMAPKMAAGDLLSGSPPSHERDLLGPPPSFFSQNMAPQDLMSGSPPKGESMLQQRFVGQSQGGLRGNYFVRSFPMACGNFVFLIVILQHVDLLIFNLFILHVIFFLLLLFIGYKFRLPTGVLPNIPYIPKAAGTLASSGADDNRVAKSHPNKSVLSKQSSRLEAFFFLCCLIYSLAGIWKYFKISSFVSI